MLAVYLRLHVTGKGLQMVTFFCAYASDNGGLLFGRLLKGPKLCEVWCAEETSSSSSITCHCSIYAAISSLIYQFHRSALCHRGFLTFLQISFAFLIQLIVNAQVLLLCRLFSPYVSPLSSHYPPGPSV